MRASCILALFTLVLLAQPSFALTCVGDCDGNGFVTVDEIILGVSIALDLQPLNRCQSLDRNGSHAVEIDELIAAVDFALNGCPTPSSVTPAVPPATATTVITPTETSAMLPTTTPTASPVMTQTGALTPTETATGPPWTLCTQTPIAANPMPSSACVPVLGMFVDCFPTSGLGVGDYTVGETGAAVADIDGDGFPDVFFWNTSGGARLFRNLGHDMQFESIADSFLIWLGSDAVMAAAFGDLDNDGKPDLVVSVDKTNQVYQCQGPPIEPFNTFHVYHNLGAGQFEEVTDAWGFGQIFLQTADKPVGRGLDLVDLNLDGRLDVVEYFQDPTARPLTFLSQPDGTTWKEAGTDVFGDARGLTWTLLFTDSTHDQLLDVFVLNDYWAGAPNKYYGRVDRSLTYEERDLLPVFGPQSYGSPMGAATADLNGDGELDMVVTDGGDQHVFSLGRDVADAWGVKQNPSQYGIEQNCWSVAVLDLENDGTPDLFFACAGFRIGWPDKAASFVLRNQGGAFAVARGLLPNEETPTWDEGLAVADFDQDGRLDLLTGGEEHPPRLLWNNIPGGHALAIRLKGKRVNAQGIGARVDVEAQGLPTQAREVFPGGTTWGYSDSQLLFGMGQATQAQVTVDWRPAGGTAIQIVDLPPGAFVIEEP
jgi:hypothetical protein